MKKEHDTKAALLKAMGHPIRYCIVEGLLNGEQHVATMVDCTGVPQPTVSQHLNILKNAGIIQCHRDGNHMYYSVCSEQAAAIVKAMT